MSATIVVMEPPVRLPIPEPRQVYDAPARRGHPRQLKLHGTRATVGLYDRSKRMLYKHIRGGQHLYGNRPGIAWNLEVICLADNWRVRPKTLVVIRHDPTKDGRQRAPYRIPWDVARRFAHAALEGDERYLIKADLDDQVVIPWPAWAGAWDRRPPLVSEPVLDEPVADALFDLPPDPTPQTFKHPV